MTPSISIITKLRKLILPDEALQLQHGLLYWQYEFFFILSTFCVVGGSIAFVGGLTSYITAGFSFMIPVVSFLFFLLVALAFSRKFDFKIRRLVSATVFLLFGAYFLSVKGYQGLGLSFLLVYPIITGVLLGSKGAIISIVIDFVVLVTMNLILYFNVSAAENFGVYSPTMWLAVSITFLILVSLITVAVSRLLTGLGESLHTETTIRQNLEIEISHRKELQEVLAEERNSLQSRVDVRTTQLNAINAELQEAIKFKDLFLATVSHELRTPVHAITGYSHLLKKSGEKVFTEKQKSYLKRLDESSEHLLQVINDILDITRIQAGKLDLKTEAILIEETCEGAANNVRSEAVKKNIQLNIIFQIPLTSIIADPQRFKQILINLLSNAIKFTPDNGLVGITIDRERENTLIEVWDTGIGIAEDEKEKIFNTFYRTSNAGVEDVQGTGLGLALVKNLVEAHGWSIDFESKKDEGSSFIIRIPDVSSTETQGNILN